MDKTSPDPVGVSEALRLLGNPYAKLQVRDEDGVHAVASDFHPLKDAERAYVRRLGNPYAVLSIAVEAEQAVQERNVSVPVVLQDDMSQPAVSKRDFEAECRRIFRQYIPAEEMGHLRPHYRAFIERNRSRAPSVRHYLLEGLRRYDLSRNSGFGALQAQFNREREPLTVQKLAEIERAVIGGTI